MPPTTEPSKEPTAVPIPGKIAVPIAPPIPPPKPAFVFVPKSLSPSEPRIPPILAPPAIEPKACPIPPAKMLDPDKIEPELLAKLKTFEKPVPKSFTKVPSPFNPKPFKAELTEPKGLKVLLKMLPCKPLTPLVNILAALFSVLAALKIFVAPLLSPSLSPRFAPPLKIVPSVKISTLPPSTCPR